MATHCHTTKSVLKKIAYFRYIDAQALSFFCRMHETFWKRLRQLKETILLLTFSVLLDLIGMSLLVISGL